MIHIVKSGEMIFIPKSNQTTIICHSECSEESLFLAAEILHSDLSSVQNDMNIQYLLTATSYQERINGSKFEFLTPGFPKQSSLARLFVRQEEEERSQNRQGHEYH